VSDFPTRLRTVFKGAKNSEIARKIGVSDQAVGDYMRGRLPNADVLIKIRESANADLNWLLTGEEEKVVNKITLPVSKSLHNNIPAESKKSESVESIELKLSGDYEINIAPNHVEIRGNILKLQRRT
jgi:transcriptional regulator with XRE-family HTH domain